MTCIQLKNDASNTPYITWIRPSQFCKQQPHQIKLFCKHTISYLSKTVDLTTYLVNFLKFLITETNKREMQCYFKMLCLIFPADRL